ncbi:MAG: SusE domain-containing protein [Bacteroidota bacterium]
MKQLSNLLLLVLLAAFSACNKVENKVYYEGGTPPTISANKSVVSLEAGSEGEEAIVFSWTNPEYRFTTGISSQDVTYTLEIDTLGGNFNSGAKYTNQISSNLSIRYTVGQLNAILGNTMLLQLEPRREYTLEARVISSIGSAVKLTSTNKVTFKATPFPPPPKVATPTNNEIWLVGGASLGGWNNPLGQPYIVNQKFTKLTSTKYELVTDLKPNDGYLVLPVMGSWATKYCIEDGVDRGSTADGGEFVFKGGGGQDFLSPASGGTFKLTFDFQLGRFTVVKQ